MNKTMIILTSLCAAAALVWSAEVLHGPVKNHRFHEREVDGIPKEWGRLVNGGSFSDGGTVFYFEAADGTIRRVTARSFSTDVQWGPDVIMIPRL